MVPVIITVAVLGITGFRGDGVVSYREDERSTITYIRRTYRLGLWIGVFSPR